MRSGVVLRVVLTLTLLAGCGRASPVSPAGPVDVVQSGRAPSVAANLVLTDLSVIATRLLDPPVWAYAPSFRIIETSTRPALWAGAPWSSRRAPSSRCHHSC